MGWWGVWDQNNSRDKSRGSRESHCTRIQLWLWDEDGDLSTCYWSQMHYISYSLPPYPKTPVEIMTNVGRMINIRIVPIVLHISSSCIFSSSSLLKTSQTVCDYSSSFAIDQLQACWRGSQSSITGLPELYSQWDEDLTLSGYVVHSLWPKLLIAFIPNNLFFPLQFSKKSDSP